MQRKIGRREALAGAAALAASLVAAPTARTAPAPQVTTDDGWVYDAYVPAASKAGQFAQYTCEFDAAWAILATFGIESTLEEQVALIGHDQRVEPYYQETANGVVIYGGDIGNAFSGDYTSNFLARSTGAPFRKVFEHYGLPTLAVDERAEIEAALAGGALIWMKATVDFLPFQSVTWVTPEGEQFPGVLGNDHAVVIMGYNQWSVVIRDVLGPTDTNWNRLYEYEVPWETFLPVWEVQGRDTLAVFPAGSEAAAEVVADARGNPTAIDPA